MRLYYNLLTADHDFYVSSSLR